MNMRTVLRPLLVALGVVLLIGAPLAAGWLASEWVFPTPRVAVIRLEGDIWGSYTALVSEELAKAAGDRAVCAVVLDVSSPGGEVSASEGLYYDVLKLREKKPVVVSVNEMAASGAYYVSSAADTIYAKPASMIGNIGVISVLPGPDVLDEVLMTTGPFKLSGGSQAEYVRQMDMMKQTFVAAILAQRSDRLTVGPEVLSRGEIWLGLQAQQMGLIDAIGSQAEAAAEAARLAGVRHFRVEHRTPQLPEDVFLLGLKLGQVTTAATLADVERSLPPGFYYRYVEPIP